MKRTASMIVGLVVFSSCYATVTGSGYYDEYPPDAYIATATPVYYEGYPSYYYQGRWYRREAYGWHVYRDEPSYLHNYRVHAPAPVVRQYYGPTYYSAPHVHGSAPVNRPPPPAYRPPPPPPRSHGAVPVR